MGRSRYSIRETQAPHFLTCTVINWIPLFTRPQTVDIILNALQYRQQHNGWKVYGYVILENHLHLVVQADDLLAELPLFKSYTARQLIDYLKECHAERVLKQMAFFRKAHKLDREYQCWEEGSHPQLIQNAEMLRQKLDYIHFNPVKRGYVDKPEHWRYSSARNYAGLEGLMPVFMDW
ncbi:MAG: transposase [Methylococcales bacterium]|nr:transposase [Methylococcales bacterium]